MNQLSSTGGRVSRNLWGHQRQGCRTLRPRPRRLCRRVVQGPRGDRQAGRLGASVTQEQRSRGKRVVDAAHSRRGMWQRAAEGWVHAPKMVQGVA